MAWTEVDDSSAITWTNSNSTTTVDWQANSATSETNRWIPYGQVLDPAGGTDFVPIASTALPYVASADRPIAVYDLSTITAAGFAGEGKP